MITECRYCKGSCIKRGIRANGSQTLCCKQCGKYQQAIYSQNARKPDCTSMIVKLLVNSCGIRSIARVLDISPTTVLKRIVSAAQSLPKPEPIAFAKSYEIDELRTFVGSKGNPVWICLAQQVETRIIVAMSIGSRSKRNLSCVVQTVLNAKPMSVMTDGLDIYRKLIPKGINITKGHCTNHIERFNLTLRNALKRLSRRTLCFSRSPSLLIAHVSLLLNTHRESLTHAMKWGRQRLG